MATAKAAAAEPAALQALDANNVFSFTQISSILNQIVRQATGQDMPAAIKTADFVAQADTAFKLGYNKLIPAISAVMTRTIFSSRPYAASFRGMLIAEEKWGYLTRKLTPYDDEAMINQEYEVKDGTQAGCWTVKTPKVLQTVLMGGGTYSHQITFFKNQLDTAFKGPDEMSRFVAMYVQEYKNQMEQEIESLALSTLVNQMGAVIQSGGGEQVVHLLTEYNKETGLSLTSTSVMQPENYVAFVLWLAGYIQNVMDLMRKRSVRYHINPTLGVNSLKVKRHTPRGFARFYMSSKWGRYVENRVTTDIFNPERLQIADYEAVPFWQSPENSDFIQVTPSTIDAAGHTITGTTVTQDNVFGILCDVESCGVGLINQWSATTPFDADKGVWAEFYHFTKKYFNDMTENAIVFLLD